MPRRSRIIAVLVLATLAFIGLALSINHAQTRNQLRRHAAAMTGGDPRSGRIAIEHRACGGCHLIPGVPGASGNVGPPLTNFAGRTYIAGVMPNTPDNLRHWIANPPAFDRLTAMPPTGVGRQEARDIAAYLYTLD
jgi:cytochrome c